MDVRSGSRIRWAIVVALALLAVPQLVAPSASAATTRNWVGPGCPRSGWTCQGTFLGTEASPVTQTASGRASVNYANCTSSCVVIQNASNGARNEAVCSQSDSVLGPSATTDQSCSVTQNNDTGDNTIRVHQTATIGSGGGAGTADGIDIADITSLVTVGDVSVTQDSRQELSTDQTTTSGNNRIQSEQTIKQNAASVAEVAVTHVQETLQLTHVTQTSNSGLNNAVLTLRRKQVSKVTGSSPEQEQDVRNNDSDPACVAAGGNCPSDPNGLVELTQQNNTGSNTARVRGSDAKSQNARSFGGEVGQFQGHPGGGWLAPMHIDPSGKLDIGVPGSKDGLTKVFAQRARLSGGQAVPSGDLTQVKDDGIRLPIIGTSPDHVKSNEYASLTGDDGVSQTCLIDAFGHADVVWNGTLTCLLSAGGEKADKTITFSRQNVDAGVSCEQNTGGEGFAADECTGFGGGTEVPPTSGT